MHFLNPETPTGGGIGKTPKPKPYRGWRKKALSPEPPKP